MLTFSTFQIINFNITNMKGLLTFFCILFFNLTFCQQLTVEETIDYINNKLNNTFRLEVDNERNFKLSEETKSIDQYWIKWQKESPSSTGSSLKTAIERTYSGKVNNIDLRRIISSNNEFAIEFSCNNNSPCFYTSLTKYAVEEKNYILGEIRVQYNDSKNDYKFELRLWNEDIRDKLFNAFSYLIESIKIDPKYQSYDSDPFANENFNNVNTHVSGNETKDEIQLKSNGGTYFISVSINGLVSEFVLDSGASEISLSSDIEKELVSKNLIKKEDYLSSGLYRIADGSIISQRRINLREVKVGSFTVKNITASVGIGNVPLLLGKSFLDKFSKWSIDNNSKRLILEK